MSELVSHAVADGVGVVVIDNPPVNALGVGVWEAIDAEIIRLNADPRVVAMVLRGAGRTFVAGADIHVFDTFRTRDDSMARSARTHAVLRRLEDSDKPIVAAIHGQAFGGGLELAMGCHFRVATVDARFGQLEVQLGIIPGAGGTQRLPRLCGAPMAIEMCARGNIISAPDAHQAGLVDLLVEDELAARASEFARQCAASGARRRTRGIEFSAPEIEAGLAACRAVEAAIGAGAGSMAARNAVRAIEAGLRLGFDAGSERERDLFAECVMSLESKALRHLFFAERQAAKIVAGAAADRPKIRRVGVTGDLAARSVLEAGCIAGGLMVVHDSDLTDADMVIDAVDDGAPARPKRLAELARIAAPHCLLVSSRRTLFEIVRRADTDATTAAAGVRLAKRLGRTPAIVGDAGAFVTDLLLAACPDAARVPAEPGASNDASRLTRIACELAAEGMRLVHAGFATRPGDIDVAACHGLGFPRFLGGPIYHAQTTDRPPV